MFEQYLEQIKKIDQKVELNIEFPDWNRTVQINVRECGCGIDGEDKVTSMYFVVKKGKVAETGEGEFYNADVVLDGEPPAIEGLFNGSLSVVGAFITKDLTIEGSVGDAVAVKVLLDAARLF
jgi:putative sterol carrier protein